MIENPTLADIRDRRSIRNYSSEPVTDQQLEAILEAGRWAPSGNNSQPWDFVVVTDPDLRAELGGLLKRITWAWGGFAAAPALIVVSVDPSQDPDHFLEDGAAATQNLCLAAQSLGLGSAWGGVYSRRNRRGNVESAIKALVSLPPTHRVVAVVPIGVAGRAGKAVRRPLSEMVHRDRYQPPANLGTERPVGAEPGSADAPPATEHDDAKAILPAANSGRTR